MRKRVRSCSASDLQVIPQTIPQGVDYIRILPELVLSAFGILVMVLDPLVDEEKSQKLLGFRSAGNPADDPSRCRLHPHPARACSVCFRYPGDGARSAGR